MSRILPILLAVGLVSACIDRSPLEARQCGECPPGVACVDGYCVSPDDDAGEDVGTPDAADAPGDPDVPDVPDMADVTGDPDVGQADASDMDAGPTCIPTGDEVCDGVDNDCDGVRDNLPGLGSSCIVGEGACRREGVFLCDLGLEAPVCSVEAGMPALEVCNGLDDDCNGVSDDLDGVLGAGCDAVEGALATCVEGLCQYVCRDGDIDANGDLGQPGSDGCECAPDGDDVCDGLDNDCDGVRDPVCCDDGVNWSLRFPERVSASDLVMAGVPGGEAVLVAWLAPGAVRYILLDSDMRPLGPLVTIDQDASLLRVAASRTGFAVAWWDGGLGAMLVRTLNLDGEPLDTVLLHEELLGSRPRDIDIGFTGRDGDPQQLAAVWALDDCDGVCLRTAQLGERVQSLSLANRVQYVRVSGRERELLVVVYTDQGNGGGHLRTSVFEPGVDQPSSGDDLNSSDSDDITASVVATEDGWVIAFADQAAFGPVELFRVDSRGRQQRSRNLGEFSARSKIGLVAPHGADELGLLHASGLITPRVRFLGIDPGTLSVEHVRDDLFPQMLNDLAAAPIADGVVLGVIDSSGDQVRLTRLDSEGRRDCP